jgi:hypothetical protein
LYLAALRENPQDGLTHHRLGVLLAKRGELALAEEHLRAAAAHSPDSAEAANDLGYCCFLQGRLKEAEASLRRALEINPNHQMAANNLGSVLRKSAAHGLTTEPAVSEMTTGAMPAVRESAPASQLPVPQPLAGTIVSPEPEPLVVAKRTVTAEPARAAIEASPAPVPAPPAALEAAPASPVIVAKQPDADSLVVVLPEPASDPPRSEATLFGAESRSIRPRTFEARGAVRDDSRVASPPAAFEPETPPAEHPAPAAANGTANEETPPPAAETVAVKEAPAEEPPAIVERRRVVRTERTSDDPSVERPLVKLVSEARFAAPCPSPDSLPASPTPEPAQAKTVEIAEEKKEANRIEPTPAAQPVVRLVAGGHNETQEDSFVPYEPGAASALSLRATPASPPRAAAPMRRSLLKTAETIPRTAHSLKEKWFSSPSEGGVHEPAARSASPAPDGPGPQSSAPRPPRRSLITTLRLLNPVDERK